MEFATCDLKGFLSVSEFETCGKLVVTVVASRHTLVSDMILFINGNEALCSVQTTELETYRSNIAGDHDDIADCNGAAASPSPIN